MTRSVQHADFGRWHGVNEFLRRARRRHDVAFSQDKQGGALHRGSMRKSLVVFLTRIEVDVNDVVVGLFQQSQSATRHPHSRIFISAQLCRLAVTPIGQHVDDSVVIL